MTHNADSYNLRAIRELLQAAFTVEELRRFCQDRSSFRRIVDSFGPGHALDDLVDEVIDYCERYVLFEELLADVKRVNPRQYVRFARELLPDPQPPGATTTAAGFDTGGAPGQLQVPDHGPAGVLQITLAARPLGVVFAISGPRSGLCILLTEGTKRVVFGRRPALAAYEVTMPDVRMSGHHFAIEVTPKKDKRAIGRTYDVWAQDLGSTNGTLVNGERLPPRQPLLLSNGDLVQAGASDFLVQLF